VRQHCLLPLLLLLLLLLLQNVVDSAAAANDASNRARGKKAAEALQNLLSAPQVGQLLEGGLGALWAGGGAVGDGKQELSACMECHRVEAQQQYCWRECWGWEAGIVSLTYTEWPLKVVAVQQVRATGHGARQQLQHCATSCGHR
jgi:hypothetical protein